MNQLFLVTMGSLPIKINFMYDTNTQYRLFNNVFVGQRNYVPQALNGYFYKIPH